MNLQYKAQGQYIVERISNGKIVESLPCRNEVLNAGLISLLSGGNFGTFVAGTSSTPPLPTDTALGTQVVSFSVSSGGGTSGTDENGDYIQWTGVGTSSAFGVNRNIAEVGLSSSTSVLFSRSLTRDSGGTPSAITVLAGEQLRLTYIFKLYLPVGELEGTFNVTIDGVSNVINFTSIRDSGTFGFGSVANLALLGGVAGNYLLQSGSGNSTATAGTPVLTADGAEVTLTATRGAIGATSYTRIVTSGPSTPRSIRVNITLSPSIPITADQTSTLSWKVGINR